MNKDIKYIVGNKKVTAEEIKEIAEAKSSITEHIKNKTGRTAFGCSCKKCGKFGFLSQYFEADEYLAIVFEAGFPDEMTIAEYKAMNHAICQQMIANK